MAGRETARPLTSRSIVDVRDQLITRFQRLLLALQEQPLQQQVQEPMKSLELVVQRLALMTQQWFQN